MWQGQQPPGGEQNPQQQNPYQQPGYQQPNPYQQPGYQQPSPYQQAGQPGQWSAPTAPSGVPQAPAGDGGSGGGGGNRTKVIAIVAATAVVVAAGVTGFLLLGDKDDDKGGKSPQADGKPSRSAAAKPGSGATDGDDSERGTAGDPKPTVPGWQVVVNPRWGTAFDVPPDWDVRKPGAIVAFEDVKTGKPLMTMSAPAYFKSKWCTSDEDKDGRTEDKALGAVGTKGANGAKNTDEVAVNQVAWWVFGGYTQPDKKSLSFDEKAKPYTTKAGIKGSIAWSRSQNTPQKGKCASDGKAITFGFKNAEGDYVAWSLYGAKGVKEEIPTETIMKILSTVRLHGDATES
ncbi:hypothetical protein [Streptomyces sp. NRRL B-1347]|uniref:hypothetical protein n=1 Tax=Streptomyces sp. NRRL B-1347 TaxID=1476877 RepID=UPI0004C53377|nr:hypothetical protein [Streptomyces sp. NRRL B-1347]